MNTHPVAETTHTQTNVIVTTNESQEKVATKSKSPGSIIKSTKKRVKIPNKFSTSSEHHTFHSVLFSSTNKKVSIDDNTNKKKEEIKHKHKNLLKTCVPDLDLSKYYFLKKTIKHIKIIFRQLYDNRIEFLADCKRKAKMARINHGNKELVFKNTIRRSKKFRQSADAFRKKLFEQLENDADHPEKNEAASQSPDHFQTKERRKLRIDEIYTLLKKKKEK